MTSINRIGRRIIIAMLLIVALLVVWQVLGAAWG
jgi:predicted nucleic acid-binding Zn ribbon protein